MPRYGTGGTCTAVTGTAGGVCAKQLRSLLKVWRAAISRCPPPRQGTLWLVFIHPDSGIRIVLGGTPLEDQENSPELHGQDRCTPLSQKKSAGCKLEVASWPGFAVCKGTVSPSGQGWNREPFQFHNPLPLPKSGSLNSIFSGTMTLDSATGFSPPGRVLATG